MDWITFKPNGLFCWSFYAVQGDRLSSQLASPEEVDEAVTGLKRQLDAVAKEIKREIAKPRGSAFEMVTDA